jgi:hypothetical protein
MQLFLNFIGCVCVAWAKTFEKIIFFKPEVPYVGQNHAAGSNPISAIELYAINLGLFGASRLGSICGSGVFQV